MKLIIAVLLSICASQSFSSTVESRSNCSKFDGDIPFAWCLTSPEMPSSKVIYVLHGMGHDEHIWIKDPESKDIRDEWANNEINEPWVIAIDFPDEGTPWALDDNLREFFVNTLMPTVEKSIQSKITSRSVLGYSMNGFSVFQLWFKNPELFEKFAALCPAVTKPKNKNSEIFDEIFDSLVKNSPFDTPEIRSSVWNKYDPMVLAPNAYALTKLRPFLLNYNQNDDYNFNSGTEKFLELNSKLELNISTIMTKESGHCENLDLKALSKFL